MEIKRLITYKKPYKRLFSIGEKIRHKFIYKYLSICTAEKCLKNNTIRFKMPSEWNDPFEKLYYTADYDNVITDSEFDNRLYACCVTSNADCEAAWKMYTSDIEKNPCVQFKIHIGQFRKFLDLYAIKNNAKLYEGRVVYNLTEKEILRLHKKTNPNYSKFFKEFSFEKYLNLMLLKRPYFKYEEEIRYLMQLSIYSKNYIDVQIPWSHCLHSIKLPPYIDQVKSNELRTILERAMEINKSKSNEQFPQWYHQKVPIVPNTLDYLPKVIVIGI